MVVGCSVVDRPKESSIPAEGILCVNGEKKSLERTVSDAVPTQVVPEAWQFRCQCLRESLNSFGMAAD
jgi:hypothetical protein